MKDGLLAEGTFKMAENTSHIKNRVYASGKEIRYKCLGNLLIEPRHSIFYYQPSSKKVFLNNRPLN